MDGRANDFADDGGGDKGIAMLRQILRELQRRARERAKRRAEKTAKEHAAWVAKTNASVARINAEIAQTRRWYVPPTGCEIPCRNGRACEFCGGDPKKAVGTGVLPTRVSGSHALHGGT